MDSSGIFGLTPARTFLDMILTWRSNKKEHQVLTCPASILLSSFIQYMFWCVLPMANLPVFMFDHWEFRRNKTQNLRHEKDLDFRQLPLGYMGNGRLRKEKAFHQCPCHLWLPCRVSFWEIHPKNCFCLFRVFMFAAMLHYLDWHGNNLLPA